MSAAAAALPSRISRASSSRRRAVAIGYDDRPGEGTLVVIDNDLVDEGRFINDRLLHSFGAVLLSVAGDQQALEAPQYVEEIILRHIAHIARVEPAVADGRRRRIGIFPVAGHDVLAPDDDFTLLAARQLSPLFVEDFQVERFENLARRSELVPVVLGRIGRNDGCSFRESVSLEHRDPDGIEKALQLRIEQCAAPDEKLQAAAECLPHLAEQHEVEKVPRRVPAGSASPCLCGSRPDCRYRPCGARSRTTVR